MMAGGRTHDVISYVFWDGRTCIDHGLVSAVACASRHLGPSRSGLHVRRVLQTRDRDGDGIGGTKMKDELMAQKIVATPLVLGLLHSMTWRLFMHGCMMDRRRVITDHNY